MPIARYEGLPTENRVRHDEGVTGSYGTKAPAFEAEVGTAEVAIGRGYAAGVTRRHVGTPGRR